MCLYLPLPLQLTYPELGLLATTPELAALRSHPSCPIIPNDPVFRVPLFTSRLFLFRALTFSLPTSLLTLHLHHLAHAYRPYGSPKAWQSYGTDDGTFGCTLQTDGGRV